MSMKIRFQKFSRNNVLLSILMILLGAALMIWPGKTLELAARILGIALLIGAVVSFVSWNKERSDPNAGYASLAIAITCVLAGVVLLVVPRGFVSMLPKIIGIVVLLNGILNLSQALEMRKQGGNWVSAVVMAALTMLLGVFLVVFAFSTMKAAVMVIGGIIIYNGVSNLLIESRYRKAGK